MKELIPLDEFIFDCHEKCISNNGRTYNYAKFLKQPLKLEMFVPCDDEGNVLEKDLFKNNSNVSTLKPYERIALEKAEERVLFKGFEIDVMQCGHKYAVNNQLQIVHDKDNGLYFLEIYSNKKPKEVFIKTIEDLIPYNLTLTKNAIDKHEL